MSNTDEKVKHYKAYLYMYGSMMVDLSKSDSYAQILVKGSSLNPFEQALRVQYA
jgi:hypothetical protein